MGKRNWVEDLECTELALTSFCDALHAGDFEDVTSQDIRDLEASASHLRQAMSLIRERNERGSSSDYTEHRIGAFEALGIRDRI